MKALMLVLALSLAAACSAPTSTEPAVDGPRMDEGAPITCRSGYAIANRNGEWVCVSETGEVESASTPASTTTSPD